MSRGSGLTYLGIQSGTLLDTADSDKSPIVKLKCPPPSTPPHLTSTTGPLGPILLHVGMITLWVLDTLGNIASVTTSLSLSMVWARLQSQHTA